MKEGGTPAGRHVTVLHWTPADVGLLHALLRPDSGARGGLSVTCVGREPADLVAPVLAPFGGVARYVRASVMDADFEEALRACARLESDDVVLILPDRSSADPDTLSRMACSAVMGMTAPSARPHVLVEVLSLQAEPEFRSLGVAWVFHEDLLRCLLLAHACVSLTTFSMLEQLLSGGNCFRFVPAGVLAGRSFHETASLIDALPDGTPVTLMGIVRGTDFLLNPPRSERIGVTDELVVLSSRPVSAGELAAMAAEEA